MNWKQRLFKPKWQNKNADIRLEAVSTEQHPDLISKLLEIAAGDEDSRVRFAAVKRLHQLENILNLHAKEKDQTVLSLLEDRIRQLASSSDEARPPLEVRMRVVESTTDRDLIEHLASHAPEADLRRAAIARVQRQGVIGDCCVMDEDAGNRSFAAGRINQQTTLKRVIDALRKRDKTLYGELQNRLHEELLEQHDRGAIKAEAVTICSTLERQSIDKAHQDKKLIEDMHKAWKRVADHVKPDMAGRYQRICERLDPPPVVVRADSVKAEEETTTATEPSTTPKDEATVELAAESPANTALAQMAHNIGLYQSENQASPNPSRVRKLKGQLDRLWEQCRPPHADDQACFDQANAAIEAMQAKIEHRQQQDEKDLEQAHKLLEKLESQLEQGELHNALETRTHLQQLARDRGRNGDWKAINSRMSGMQARLRELREWQHWSNNKIRKRLIAEMEVLPSADLHPDALLDRIKSLQVEWKELEKSEQIPGDKKFVAAPWMWRKFNTAGNAAFDTAKPFLDKRSEIQSRHAQSLATFCAELEQLAAAEPPDWVALGKGLNRGRKKLRDLNSVPYNQRQKIARKLKAALDKANARVQENYQAVEKEKMKLIRAASQLVHLPERSEAIDQAKSLQSNWKDAGRLWRSREQELWEQFREHLDPLFNELKEERASIRAADSEKLAAQKTLCAELQEILNSADELSALHGKVQGLQDSWKDIQHPDRRLLGKFQAMVEEYEKKVRAAETKLVESNRERWWLKSSLLHDLTVNGRTQKGTISKKAESMVEKSWPGESSDDELESHMDQVCKDILAGDIAAAADERVAELKAQARVLCIGLEFIAGLPSPDEDRDQRMKYQVDRLAESMSGESIRKPANEEALEAEKTWLAMYELPDDDFNQFGKRVKQAITKIMESI